jgi:hypothetical protein
MSVLSVPEIVRYRPTITPVVGDPNETPERVAPFTLLVQLSPPFVLRRILADLPTATSVFLSANATDVRSSVEPVFWNFHVTPPSSVRSIAPLYPAIAPVEDPRKLAP